MATSSMQLLQSLVLPESHGITWEWVLMSCHLVLEQIHGDASHLGHSAHQLQNYNAVVIKVQERRCWAGSFT